MTLLRISTRFKMAQSEDTLRSIDNTFIYNLETLCRAGKSENTLRSIHNIFIYNLEHFAELVFGYFHFFEGSWFSIAGNFHICLTISDLSHLNWVAMSDKHQFY